MSILQNYHIQFKLEDQKRITFYKSRQLSVNYARDHEIYQGLTYYYCCCLS